MPVVILSFRVELSRLITVENTISSYSAPYSTDDTTPSLESAALEKQYTSRYGTFEKSSW
jgi:hypothetical protein